jgi:hypothetical protein
MTSRLDTFRRHVRAAAGIYARTDRGELTGRNSDATADTLAWHVSAAAELLAAACLDDADPLPEYLDAPRGARLAAAWARVERRHAGLDR